VISVLARRVGILITAEHLLLRVVFILVEVVIVHMIKSPVTVLVVYGRIMVGNLMVVRLIGVVATSVVVVMVGAIHCVLFLGIVVESLRIGPIVVSSPIKVLVDLLIIGLVLKESHRTEEVGEAVVSGG
jgi:hypothetical protein